jgi:hypothetical protein
MEDEGSAVRTRSDPIELNAPDCDQADLDCA